jgi:hypothetical protein
LSGFKTYTTVLPVRSLPCKTSFVLLRAPIFFMHFSWLNIYFIDSQEVVLSAKLYKLWKAAIKATANPAFSLSVFEHANALHLKALGVLIVSCENLAQALEKVIH